MVCPHETAVPVPRRSQRPSSVAQSERRHRDRDGRFTHRSASSPDCGTLHDVKLKPLLREVLGEGGVDREVLGTS